MLYGQQSIGPWDTPQYPGLLTDSPLFYDAQVFCAPMQQVTAAESSPKAYPTTTPLQTSSNSTNNSQSILIRRNSPKLRERFYSLPESKSGQRTVVRQHSKIVLKLPERKADQKNGVEREIKGASLKKTSSVHRHRVLSLKNSNYMSLDKKQSTPNLHNTASPKKTQSSWRNITLQESGLPPLKEKTIGRGGSNSLIKVIDIKFKGQIPPKYNRVPLRLL